SRARVRRPCRVAGRQPWQPSCPVSPSLASQFPPARRSNVTVQTFETKRTGPTARSRKGTAAPADRPIGYGGGTPTIVDPRVKARNRPILLVVRPVHHAGRRRSPAPRRGMQFAHGNVQV